MALYPFQFNTTSPSDALNYSISCSVGSNALTIALKDANGNDPAAGSPVQIAMRSTTAGTGTYSTSKATAATSLVISSGSTLGHRNATATNIWIYAIDNAGTVELGACTTLFDTSVVLSSSAEGGAGAADSNSTIYSTTARSSKAMRVIAKLISNQSTAGTWAAVPTNVSVQYYDSPLAFDPASAYWTTTTGTTVNNTSPTIPFAVYQYDTHNSWDGTNTYTIPRAGKWRINAASYFVVNNSTSQAAYLQIYVNAATTYTLTGQCGVGASNTYNIQGSKTINFAKGDTVAIKMYSDTSTTLNTSAERNYFQIEQVG